MYKINYDDYFAEDHREKHRKQKKHVHEIIGETSETKQHIHEYSFKTKKTVGEFEKHIHVFEFKLNGIAHSHKMIGRTSPPIETQYGDHTHKIEGMTSLDYGHLHFYEEYTSSEIYL